jgi:hypothetical protein
MINKIECKGELKLGDFSIPCYVLENGTRVLSGRGIQEALKMTEGGRKSRIQIFQSFKPTIHKNNF